MSEHVRQLLLYGISAAKSGNLNQAQSYLKRAETAIDATHEQKADACIWLAKIATDANTKREYLSSVIAYDPLNAIARRELAILDGRLDPTDLVNPDTLGQERPGTPESVRAQRFTCAQCGAPIPFAPEARELECSYCGHRQSLLESLKHSFNIVDQDFVVALATNKGHSVPENMTTYTCQGCQATMLTDGQLSDHCPYCGSPHVIKTQTKAQILPDGIIPFAIDQDHARQHFREWIRRRFKQQHIRTTRMRGVYIPVWVFDIMGQLDWRIVENQNQFNLIQPNRSLFQELINPSSGANMFGMHKSGETKRNPDGSHIFFADKILVAATRKVPYALHDVLDTFELQHIEAFNAAMLSGWIAVQYEIAVSDASLVARQKAIKSEWREAEMKARLHSNDSSDVRVIPKAMSVDTYRLWLLPFWFGNYRLPDDNTTYTVIVNGHNGQIRGEQPKSALGQWLDDLV